MIAGAPSVVPAASAARPPPPFNRSRLERLFPIFNVITDPLFSSLIVVSMSARPALQHMRVGGCPGQADTLALLERPVAKGLLAEVRGEVFAAVVGELDREAIAGKLDGAHRRFPAGRRGRAVPRDGDAIGPHGD